MGVLGWLYPVGYPRSTTSKWRIFHNQIHKREVLSICEPISSKCEFPNFSSFPGLWLVVMVTLPKNVLGGTFWQLHCRLHKLSNAQLNERKGCLEGEEEVTALNLI